MIDLSYKNGCPDGWKNSQRTLLAMNMNAHSSTLVCDVAPHLHIIDISRAVALTESACSCLNRLA